MNEENNEKKSDEYYCSECNTKVNSEDIICPKCGADLSEIDKDVNEFEERTKVGWMIFSVIFTLIAISKCNVTPQENDSAFALGNLIGYSFPIYLVWAYSLRIWPWKKQKIIIDNNRITFIKGNNTKTISILKSVNVTRNGNLITVVGVNEDNKDIREFIEKKNFNKDDFDDIKLLLESKN